MKLPEYKGPLQKDSSTDGVSTQYTNSDMNHIGFYKNGRLKKGISLSENAQEVHYKEYKYFSFEPDTEFSIEEQKSQWLNHYYNEILAIQNPRFCKFCGKNSEEVKKLIMGPNSGICDECVALCNDILAPEE